MTSTNLRFSDVQVGEQLPELRTNPDATQLFLFSAATHTAHRIHYDHRWATEVEGFPGIVVQGPLQEALLARAITEWAGPTARLTRLSVQSRSAALVDTELRFGGTVTEVRTEGGRGVLELDVHVHNPAGELLMPGQATIVVPAS